MPNTKPNKKQGPKHKYQVGDVLVAQGAQLKVVGLIKAPDGSPAYEMVSPHTQGEPWLVGESWLSTARKARVAKS